MLEHARAYDTNKLNNGKEKMFFYLVTQVDANIVLSLLLLNAKKDNNVYVDLLNEKHLEV